MTEAEPIARLERLIRELHDALQSASRAALKEQETTETLTAALEEIKSLDDHYDAESDGYYEGRFASIARTALAQARNAKRIEQP